MLTVSFMRKASRPRLRRSRSRLENSYHVIQKCAFDLKFVHIRRLDEFCFSSLLFHSVVAYLELEEITRNASR